MLGLTTNQDVENMAKPILSLFYLCLLAKTTGTQLMCNHNYRFLKQINYGYIAIPIIGFRLALDNEHDEQQPDALN